MGKTDSWNGHGGRPLEDCPDAVLKSARGWFKHKIHDGPPSTLKDAMKHQVICINLVLNDRDAHNPQHAMDFPVHAAVSDEEMLARAIAPDTHDGLPF